VTPPEYDWKYLTAPLSLLMGQDDALGTLNNTQHIVDHLVHPYTWDNMTGFEHSTFLMAKDPNQLFAAVDREISEDKKTAN
jgi:hypothetical protein